MSDWLEILHCLWEWLPWNFKLCTELGHILCLVFYFYSMIKLVMNLNVVVFFLRHINLISIITYLLTPWCRVLLEQLSGLQLVKKFPVFHGTRRFITALTSFHHPSLSWASPVQSIYPHSTSWSSILILSTHLNKHHYPTK